MIYTPINVIEKQGYKRFSIFYKIFGFYIADKSTFFQLKELKSDKMAYSFLLFLIKCVVLSWFRLVA